MGYDSIYIFGYLNIYMIIYIYDYSYIRKNLKYLEARKVEKPTGTCRCLGPNSMIGQIKKTSSNEINWTYFSDKKWMTKITVSSCPCDHQNSSRFLLYNHQRMVQLSNFMEAWGVLSTRMTGLEIMVKDVKV